MTIAPDHARLAKKRPGVPLIDGIDKVTGKACYTADLDHSDALVGRIFRSPVSHADIIRLDVSRALALDGVVAVVTGDDCTHTYGVLPIAMNELDFPDRSRKEIGCHFGYFLPNSPRWRRPGR